jgi:hypothetical protein
MNRPKSLSRRRRIRGSVSRRPQRPRRPRFSFFKPDCQRTGALSRDRNAAQPIDFTLSAATGEAGEAGRPYCLSGLPNGGGEEVRPRRRRGADICRGLSPVNSRARGNVTFLKCRRAGPLRAPPDNPYLGTSAREKRAAARTFLLHRRILPAPPHPRLSQRSSRR